MDIVYVFNLCVELKMPYNFFAHLVFDSLKKGLKPEEVIYNYIKTQIQP